MNETRNQPKVLCQIVSSCLCLLGIERLLGVILHSADLSKYYSSFQELTAASPPKLIPTTSILHDEDSLTTFVWERGVSIHDKGKQQGREEPQSLAQTPHRQMNFTIDAATIGSGNASALTRAQMETWGRQVRYFFGATESDDADPQCNADITSIETVFDVTRVCRRNRRFGTELQILPKTFYANKVWIGAKAVEDSESPVTSMGDKSGSTTSWTEVVGKRKKKPDGLKRKVFFSSSLVGKQSDPKLTLFTKRS
jgi:hypothetical protein